MTRIAIIGAGLAGLVAARTLGKRHDVTVFEKSRGVGGRMATRYAGQWEFDHGAQFFIAKTPDFEAFLAPLIGEGIVAAWHANFAEFEGDKLVATRAWDDSYPHYVAMPGMNALGKRLALNVDVRTGVTVAAVKQAGSGWTLSGSDERTLGKFDWIVFTAPAAQSAALMPPASRLRHHADQVRMLGCFALLLGFDETIALDWQAALLRDADISWIAINNSKPGRDTGFSVVVHATNAWADQHLNDDPDSVETNMLRSACTILGADAADAKFRQLHRWRYANIGQQAASEQVDETLQLAACGDWFVRGRVEGAYTSALRLTRALDQLI